MTIAIGSPAADPLGRGGIRARVNSHFFERFAGAILQSALDIGVNLAGRAGERRRRRSSSSCRRALQGAPARSSSRAQITPTLTVRQGTSISIFVARDLDFTGAETGDERRRRRRARAVYLRSYLAPLTGMLARPDVTDIYVNRPGELWVETIGGAIERHDAPALDEATLARLARQIAALVAPGDQPRASPALRDPARRRARAGRRAAGDARPAGAGDPQACLARSHARRLCRRRRLRRDARRAIGSSAREVDDALGRAARRRRHCRHARRRGARRARTSSSRAAPRPARPPSSTPCSARSRPRSG